MSFIEVAMAAARSAGKIQLDNLGKLKDISFKDVKGKNDIVTKIDTECEDLITSKLRENFPEHSILAEEGGNHENSGSQYKWIVDPLDGTMNYSNDFPFFCVSIALEYQNEVVLGVIYEPVRDEMFSAEKGKGAKLNGENIKVSDTELIEDSFVVCGTFYYHNEEIKEKHFLILKKINEKVRGIRRDGSAALDLCYVACGRYDAFWECGLKAWDVAAGSLIVEEAGGKITKYDGAEFSIYGGELLASNSLIHKKMDRLLSY